MGLDLTLYTKTKDTSFDDHDHHIELAYGRKTWAISDFFTGHCGCEEIDDGFIYRVTKEDWDKFINTVKPFLIYPGFVSLIENYDDKEDEYGMIENVFHYFLDETIGGYMYQLGAEWEAYAVVQWYKANEKVQKAFAHGLDVFLERSY